jgi:pantetheine-phosphate adenylyltransferase
MKVGIYPGSFDPVTKGHMDVIERSAKLFDKVIVGVLKNSQKECLFTADERVEMIKVLTDSFRNVEVIPFDGLLVDFVQEHKADAIIRGLRDVTDFNYELHLAHVNKVLLNDVETIFFTTNASFVNVSSSIVKEIASYGGDISNFVDSKIASKVYKKLGVDYGK